MDNPTTTFDDSGRDPYTIIQEHANYTVTFCQRTMHITEKIIYDNHFYSAFLLVYF